VKKLPDVGGVDVGHGLFSDAGIAAGSFIAEYVGVLYARRGAPSAYSLFYPCHDGSYEVDAAEYGNVCRFVNHSSTRCNAAYKHVLHQVMCVLLPVVLLHVALTRHTPTAPPVMSHVPVPYDIGCRARRVLCRGGHPPRGANPSQLRRELLARPRHPARGAFMTTTKPPVYFSPQYRNYYYYVIITSIIIIFLKDPSPLSTTPRRE